MPRLCANLSDLVIKVRPETTGTEPDNLPGPFCGALKIIPEMTDEQRNALNMCHNKFVGHGVKRTVEKLIKLPIDWEHMVQYTYVFIQQCACCQKMNATRIPIRVHKYDTSAYKPFHVLNIDFIGLLPDSSHVLSSSVLSHDGRNCFGVQIILPNRLPIAFFNTLEDTVHPEWSDLIGVHILLMIWSSNS